MTDGRALGLERLRAGLERARAGGSTVLLIRGDVGTGKSWLIDRLLDEVDAGILVLRGIGHPAEADLPFAGLHQLLAPLLPRLPELPRQQAVAVSAALALREGLRGDGPTRDDSSGAASPGDRLAVSAGVLGLLTLEAETRPVLLVLDDLHWVDTSTRKAITFVARRLDSEADAVMIVAAGRPGEGRPALESRFERIELEPLGLVASRTMLRERHPDLDAEVAIRIVEESGGLPLALVQIPADLSAEQRSGSAPLPVPLPLGATLDEVYSSRLAELGDPGRRALALASLDELPLDQLDAALGELGLGLGDLEAAQAAGLVQLTKAGCTFSHPTVRAAAQRAVGYPQLQAAHAAIVAALPEGSVRAAWHLDALAAGPDDAIATALDHAAQDAWARSAYNEAGRAWRASAERCTDAAVAHARRARAVDAYLRCGAEAALAAVLSRLIEDSDDAAERASWQSLLLITGLYSDTAAPPYEEMEAMASALVPDSSHGGAPDAASRLLTNYALILMVAGESKRASIVVDRLRELVPGHPFSLSDRLIHDVVDLLVGRPGAGRFLNSDWADQLSDAELCDPTIPVSPTVVHIAWTGNIGLARRILDRQYEALQAGGGISLMGLCLAQRGNVLQLTGDWAAAHAAFTSASALTRASDFAAPLPHILLMHAYLLAARGEQETVDDILSDVRSLPAAQRLIHRYLEKCVVGLRELTLGRCEAAMVSLSEAGRLEQETGAREPALFSRFGDYFEAAWRLRRAEEALAELDEFEERARAVGRHSALAIASRCRGMIAEAAGIDTAFQNAAALHAQAPNPFESARTDLAWGQRLRRERRRSDARVPLHRALDAFESLGADPWVAMALAELAACGERRSAEPSGPLSGLTPRELEVALAVVGGASNADAASRLVVSRRTVEYHLAALFRKLGVHSRTELAELLSA